MKVVPFLVLGLFLFSIFSIPLSQNVSASVLGGIPPTKAFPKVAGPNSTGGSGLLTAKNYSDTLHLRSNSINFTMYQKNNTLDIELKNGNSTESTTASNLLGQIQWFKQLVGTDLQFYGLDLGNGLSSSKNSTTYKIILTMHFNNYTCPAGQFANAGSNVTGITSCGTPSGGSGTTLDTMQNVGSGQASVYAGNTTNTNFQFKTITIVHGSITNGTNLITITIPVYQNNTGQNLGTHGIGPYFGMSGSVLQFLSDLSANSICAYTSNSTNKILTCNAIASINSQTGPAIVIHPGTLRNVKVTNNTNDIQIDSNNTAQGSNLGTHGIGPYFSNFNATKLQFLSDLSANSICAYTSNSTNNILTCNAITSINSQTGPAIVIHPGKLRNVKVTNGTNNLQIDSNNTAYARNILSNSGTSGGSGVGPYINNTNTTLINLKSIVSRNQYILATANNTNIILNGSVPTTNVVDVYDTTIGDYSIPSSATASSFTNYTFQSATNGSTALSSAGWNGVLWSQKFYSLTVGQKIISVGLNVQTANGNVRVKIYQDDGTSGRPSTLLGESGSLTVPGTGIRNFTLTTPATVPASGRVWAAFETDSATLSIKYNSAGTNTQCQVAHGYGAGPSPFGACTANTTHDIKMYVTLNKWYPSSNAVDGSTSTFWESNSEVHPWIYADTGSAQILSGTAIYWNSTSTATQLLLQTSTDSSNWNTKRTVNTNLLTNNAWNYIRWDLDNSTERYVRYYGNDGTSKQLSIYEIKVLIPSSTTLMLRHGHEFIDPTNTTLPLNR